jgi:hypothetical protein
MSHNAARGKLKEIPITRIKGSTLKNLDMSNGGKLTCVNALRVTNIERESFFSQMLAQSDPCGSSEK